ncbi:MAG: HNH endonuclease [Gammaproteobacteria bacterium]|nr:HNH endonuclease [Gammaproteobacteria bacterium]
MSLDDYKRKFVQINVNPAGDHVSPHKICMLLAVLDLARSGALRENRITYSPALLDRYMYYFKAVRFPNDHPNPYFPFFHLKGRLRNREDSFWHLIPLLGRESVLNTMDTARSVSAITDNIACAMLDQELFELLQEEQNIDQLSESLATHWFGRGLQDLNSVVTQGKQISVYEHKLRCLTILKVAEEAPRYVRDPAFRRVVTEIYDYRCAATGLRLVLPDGTAMVEAAHIHPFSNSGDDDPRNGLALTPDMHWAMDAYLIAPGPDYKWHVSKQLDSRIPDHRMLTELSGKPLFLPRESRMYPRQDVLEWRASNLSHD